MHQVGQSLPLHHAFVLEANKEVIAERERPPMLEIADYRKWKKETNQET